MNNLDSEKNSKKKRLSLKTIEWRRKLKKARRFADGNPDTIPEWLSIGVIVLNVFCLAMLTSRNISENTRSILEKIDLRCMQYFIIELIFKGVVYNKDFFGSFVRDKERIIGFKIKKEEWTLWNISDLLIVIISLPAYIPSFAVVRVIRVFRSIRIIKAAKIISLDAHLRRTFKNFFKAIPGIMWTFYFLFVFAFIYAVIGTNLFGDVFPAFFGTLGHSFLSLCQILTFDSWVSQIARPITQHYPFAWIYFISYAFIAAYVLMSVITSLIVNAMGEDDTPKKLDQIIKQVGELNVEMQKNHPKLLDAHTHIAPHSDEITVLYNSVEAKDWDRVQQGKNIIPFYGIHPKYVKKCSINEQLSMLKNWVEAKVQEKKDNSEIYFGIGETGLDKKAQLLKLEDQETLFKEHLDLAVKYKLPVTVHCVECWERFKKIITSPGVPDTLPILLHRYSGSLETANELLQLKKRKKIFFSFSPSVMKDNKEKQVEILRKIPLNRIFLETDIDPEFTEFNEDEYLQTLLNLYVFTAQVKDCSVEEVKKAMQKNLKKLFSP